MEGLFDVDVDENGPFIVSYIPEREEMDTNPINNIEKKMKLLLKMQGFIDKDIQFKQSNKQRLLKIGYWNYLDEDDLLYIQQHAKVILTPRQWEDEDTGNLVAYEIKVK